MATNSSQAGFLSSSTSLDFDDDLDDALNPTIAGLTGLDPDQYVRPRFQEAPPVQPDRSVDWVAFGVNRTVASFFSSVVQVSDASAEVTRYAEHDVLLSFYGPHAQGVAERFRDGLQIGQNRDALNLLGIGVIDCGEARKVPALFKEKWLSKWDMTWRIRRNTTRAFPILTLLSAGFVVSASGANTISLPVSIPSTPHP